MNENIKTNDEASISITQIDCLFDSPSHFSHNNKRLGPNYILNDTRLIFIDFQINEIIKKKSERNDIKINPSMMDSPTLKKTHHFDCPNHRIPSRPKRRHEMFNSFFLSDFAVLFVNAVFFYWTIHYEYNSAVNMTPSCVFISIWILEMI